MAKPPYVGNAHVKAPDGAIDTPRSELIVRDVFVLSSQRGLVREIGHVVHRQLASALSEKIDDNRLTLVARAHGLVSCLSCQCLGPCLAADLSAARWLVVRQAAKVDHRNSV